LVRGCGCCFFDFWGYFFFTIYLTRLFFIFPVFCCATAKPSLAPTPLVQVRLPMGVPLAMSVDLACVAPYRALLVGDDLGRLTYLSLASGRHWTHTPPESTHAAYTLADGSHDQREAAAHASRRADDAAHRPWETVCQHVQASATGSPFSATVLLRSAAADGSGVVYDVYRINKASLDFESPGVTPGGSGSHGGDGGGGGSDAAAAAAASAGAASAHPTSGSPLLAAVVRNLRALDRCAPLERVSRTKYTAGNALRWVTRELHVAGFEDSGVFSVRSGSDTAGVHRTMAKVKTGLRADSFWFWADSLDVDPASGAFLLVGIARRTSTSRGTAVEEVVALRLAPEETAAHVQSAFTAAGNGGNTANTAARSSSSNTAGGSSSTSNGAGNVGAGPNVSFAPEPSRAAASAASSPPWQRVASPANPFAVSPTQNPWPSPPQAQAQFASQSQAQSQFASQSQSQFASQSQSQSQSQSHVARGAASPITLGKAGARAVEKSVLHAHPSSMQVISTYKI
jgi:hypothetical protein